MKHFYVSARYKMKLPDGVTSVSGGVIMPSGIPLHTVLRRDLTRRYPHLERRLLDPQLYLTTLNAATCRKTCAYLASYGWFPATEAFPYDSSAQKQSEWRRDAESRIVKAWTGQIPTDGEAVDDAIRCCVKVQLQLGVEALILPAPLTVDMGTPFDAELDWLERGLAIAQRVEADRPVLASVALSDTALRGVDPWENPLLDLILDQVTARRVDGVYVVLEQANEDGYYCTHPNTVGALLRLCNGLKHGGIGRIVVAFAGTAGLLALVSGADSWTTGWYRGERRLRLVDFEQQEGRAVPAYYSHPLGGELHMQSDLDRVVGRGFLPRLADSTDASEGLLRALAEGSLVRSVPEWEHRPSNINASTEHFLTICQRETASLSPLTTEQSEEWARRWIENATTLAADLYAVGSFQPRTAVNHQHGWQQAFQSYLANRY